MVIRIMIRLTPFRNMALVAMIGVLAFLPTASVALASRRAALSDVRRSLYDIVRFYGYPSVDVAETRFRCSSDYSNLSFQPNSRRMFFNGRLIYLNGAVGGPRDRWRIDSTDADTVIDALLRPSRVLPGKFTRVVVLDPGHGGSDLGAVGSRNVQEKRVVLDIARRVRAKLHPDFSVHLTRTGDQFVSLEERVRIANRLGADIFISIHINGAVDKSVSGVETFVLPAVGYPSTAQVEPTTGAHDVLPGNEFDAANTLLGYLLQSELLAVAGTPDRGLKRARFTVLKDINCPAALVECGFVTNTREEARFLQANYREGLADAIARAVRRYAARLQ